MSHFTLAVITKTKNPKEVERLLEPFNENTQDEKYLEFIDYTEEVMKNWNEKIIERFVKGNSGFVSYWDDCFKKPNSFGYGSNTHYNPEDLGYDKVMVSGSQLYESLEEFADRYFGYQKYYDKYGYFSNRNAKWDWWTIGGRWSNLIPNNSCKISKIDWSINKDDYNKSLRFWEVVVDGDALRDGEKEDDFWSMYRTEYYISHYGTKEKYATEQNQFGTYALLTEDGKWYEKGEMGWFGMDSSTVESTQEYFAFFREYLDNNPDLYITIVDCHI